MRSLPLMAAMAGLVLIPTAARAAWKAVGPPPVAGSQVATIHLHVEGIACDACSKRLRGALTKLDGVVDVRVDAGRTELTVDFDPAKITEQTIRTEVTRHGFRVK